MVLSRGSLNVLLGPTLSGKTSLMRLMAGLDRPTSGSVWFDGVDVTGVAVQKRSVAMVYQQFINYPSLTVYENIASPLRIAGVDAATLDREVRKAAELLRLTPYLDRTPLNLSGGQQQRTALARAIVKKAKLVLLDEPLANLDYKLREELRAELPKIFSESGAIFVYATTEPSEALLLGGNTATLSEGRVTQFGPTVDVYRRPADLVSAMTFSDPPLNAIAVEKRGGQFVSGGVAVLPVPGHLAHIADGSYTLGFQPHHVSLAARKAGCAPRSRVARWSRRSLARKASCMCPLPARAWCSWHTASTTSSRTGRSRSSCISTTSWPLRRTGGRSLDQRRRPREGKMLAKAA